MAERSYVKELLKTYSVDQAIAIRLSKEMKSRTTAVYKVLKAYNAIASTMLEFEEAANQRLQYTLRLSPAHRLTCGCLEWKEHQVDLHKKEITSIFGK